MKGKYRMSQKLMAWCIAVAMAFCLLPANPREAEATTTLKNPSVADNGDGTSTITWDCVWFGSYPQSSYQPSAAPTTPTDGETYTDVDGTKFVYIEGFYEPSENPYYKVEPIKWRVLRVDGDDVFLLADQTLDIEMYNDHWTGTTWEGCTLRSWLNGYDGSANTVGTDYSSDNFIDMAFTETEQNAINTTAVVNEDNPHYGTEGGGDTQDKIYLLSVSEALDTSYGFSGEAYGVSSVDGKADAARCVKNTEYVKERGVSYTNDTAHYPGDVWRLRTPGQYSDGAAMVWSTGIVDVSGDLNYARYPVRPVLHMDLTSDRWSYAGTVSVVGTAREDVTEDNSSDPPEDTQNDSSKPSDSAELPQKTASEQNVQQTEWAPVGTTAETKAGQFKVTKEGEVAFTKPTKKNAAKAAIPATVTIDGKSHAVTEIAKNAFKDSSKLKKVVIGKNVTKIGNGAFLNCKKLKTVEIKSAKLKKVGRKAFLKIHGKAVFKAPKNKVKAYRKLLKGRIPAKAAVKKI